MIQRTLFSSFFCLAITLPIFARAEDPVTASLNRGVAFFEDRLARDPDDFNAANQLTDRLLRRQRWTGNLKDLRRAGEVAELSLKSVPANQNPGGLAARGEVALSMHRFSEARDIAIALKPLMHGKAFPFQLLGDAELELGNLDEAEAAFGELQRIAGSDVGVDARLARLAWMRGKSVEARTHFENALDYAQAEPESTPESVVWALVQVGELAFKTGDWPRAESNYIEAQKLAPNHWSVLDHLAELRGAQGQDAEAVTLYEKAIAAADRPELHQALGDYHAFMQRPKEAAAAFVPALAGYRESLDRGEVLYVHHLAGFYADSELNADDAVKWARRDLELRKSAYAWDALAWAQYRQGDADARDSSEKALAQGLVDPHVIYHAAMIHMSAGKIADGQRLLKRCAEVNPHFNAFHAHR